jgi:hypothetical protein
MSSNSQDNVGIALGGTDKKSQDKYDNTIANLKRENGVSAEDRKKKAEARKAESASIQQKSANQVQGKGGTGAKEGASDAAKKKAAECIEAFRKTHMTEMRRKAVEKYGENYKATKAAAKDAAEKAEAASAAAQKKKEDVLDALKKEKDPAKKKALGAQYGQAKGEADQKARESADADRKLKNVNCLHKQARRLCGQPPPPPYKDFPAPRDGKGNIVGKNGTMPPFSGNNPQ